MYFKKALYIWCYFKRDSMTIVEVSLCTLKWLSSISKINFFDVAQIRFIAYF